MTDTTIFYIVGSSLTVIALIISFIGVRNHEFPPEGAARRGLVGVFAALVVATAAFAILGAREEQSERREHFAEFFAEAAEAEEAAPGGEAEAGDGEPAEEDAGDSEGGDELETQGASVFADNGCGSCHVLAAAGTSGAVGPNLDETLTDKDAAYVETAIVDPDAEVAEGFGAGIMPGTYGEDLSSADIEALVAYLQFAVATG